MDIFKIAADLVREGALEALKLPAPHIKFYEFPAGSKAVIARDLNTYDPEPGALWNLEGISYEGNKAEAIAELLMLMEDARLAEKYPESRYPDPDSMPDGVDDYE